MSVLLFTSVALAAGGEAPPDMNAIAFHAINFFLLISLLTFLLRNKIKDALANRALRVRNDIDKSNRLRKEAQQKFEELESRLEAFEIELTKMKANAEVEAQNEQQGILARAEEDAARIAESAQRSIRDETERARQALRREVAELSVDLARERLSSGVTSDDQNRLAGDFIDTVKGKNGAANG